MQPQSFFPSTYIEARERFLSGAKKAGAEVTEFQHPMSDSADTSLATSVATLGEKNASSVFFCNSGTHGVEGYAGSGIQIGLFESGLYKEFPRDVLLVLSHALNPYGFAYERRVTEDNVDLNRNFVDFSKPLPDNTGYEDLHSFLLPKMWEEKETQKAVQEIREYASRYGETEFKSVLLKGQYAHQDGLFYGGRAPTWSNKTWREILRRFARGRERVALIDLHTGLGKKGEAALHNRHAYKRSVSWYGAKKVKRAGTGESDAPEMSGNMSKAVLNEAPDVEFTANTLELGTLIEQEVLHALRGENWLYHKGNPKSPAADPIRRRMREAFYVETPEWKGTVWKEAKEIIRQTFQGLKSD